MKNSIRIYDRPTLRDPVLLTAWPGMGNVALGVVGYLISKLRAEEFAEIEPYDFFYPTGIAISDGLIQKTQLPYNKFYYSVNASSDRDIIFFLSNAQPPQEKGYLMANKIVDVALEFDVSAIYASAAMAVPVSHRADPGVWGTATSRQHLDQLNKYDVQFMKDGTISGLNGLILEIGMERSIEGIALLGELPLYTIQLNNPKASRAIINILKKLMPLDIDTEDLDGMAEKAEGEIDRYILEVKQAATEDSDESETKKGLPPNVQSAIEQLFSETGMDRSRAIELKELLDNYGVFKDYEDRFLDLFRE